MLEFIHRKRRLRIIFAYSLCSPSTGKENACSLWKSQTYLALWLCWPLPCFSHKVSEARTTSPTKQKGLVSLLFFLLTLQLQTNLVSILEWDTHNCFKMIIHIVCECACWNKNSSVRSRCQESVINQVIQIELGKISSRGSGIFYQFAYGFN